jgi:hypothetical protein
MMNSSKLYKASPEAFFAALDNSIAQLETRLEECATRLDGISGLADRFLTDALPAKLVAAPCTGWSYFAALPNPYFADIFAPEHGTAGAKRWVGKSGRIGARLGLSRALQYDFAIHVVDFASHAAEASFALTINGQPYPWLDTAGHVFRTVVLEDPEAATFEFSIGVDPATIAEDKDVSFSFSMITVTRRG